MPHHPHSPVKATADLWHPSRFFAQLFAVATLTCCLLLPASAQRLDDRADDVYEKTGVEEQFGKQLPMELIFTDESGASVRLGDLFEPDKPVILVMAYYECPMLCTLVLNGLRDALREVPLEAGEEYRIITVSIDPGESAELAAANRDRYVASLGDEVPKDAWRCLTGEQEAISQLADAIGFRYTYDAEKDQYAHAAVLHLITPKGKIARYLYGIQFDPQNLRLALLEASEGEIGSFTDRVLLFCYQYDSESQGYTLMAYRIMRIGGVLTMVALGGLLSVLWYRERHRRDQDPDAAAQPVNRSNV